MVDAYEWTTRLIDALSYEFITEANNEDVRSVIFSAFQFACAAYTGTHVGKSL